jgi:hypothetical protein
MTTWGHPYIFLRINHPRLQTIGINTPQYFDISFIESSREKPSIKFVVLNTKCLLQGMIIAAGRLSFIKKLNLAKRTTFFAANHPSCQARVISLYRVISLQLSVKPSAATHSKELKVKSEKKGQKKRMTTRGHPYS